MRAVLISTALLAVLSTPALAQETPVSDQVSPLEVVARLPSLADDQPGVTVITAAEIAQRQAQTAYDLLQTAPGLDIYRTGAFGGITTVRQRGASNDKTLVLIDGVPQNDASQPSGGFDFARLPLDEVSRVEVLNGPQGSLWGSDAIGGVIAFTTKKPNGVSLRAEGGSFGTLDGAISAGKSTDTWSAGVFASSTRSDGISAADKRDGNSEKDGFTNDTIGVRGGGTLAGIKLDGRVEYDRSRNDFDGFPGPFYDHLADTNDVARFKSWNGYGRAQAAGFGFDHTLLIGASDLDRRYAGEGGDYGYTARDTVYRYTAERGGLTSPLTTTFGVEREENKANLSSGDVDLSANSAFAVARLRNSRASLTGSLRYDDPAKFKGLTTGKLAGAIEVGGGWKLLASIGQGFKTPSLSEAVCDFCSATPVALSPEKALGYDAEAVWRSGDGRFGFDLDAYRLQVKDQIGFSAGRYVNISKARTNGLEASADAVLGAGFGLKLSYSLTDAVDDSTGQRLLRVPEHSASALLTYAQGPWSGALTVRGEGSQADSDLDGFTRIQRKGFIVGDVAAAYAINSTISLTARVQNLTDRHYQEVFGYGEPGRALYVGLTLRR